jgi:hypothetical protein
MLRHLPGALAMSVPPQDPLQPVLRDAEAELRRRLHEACEAEARGVENESAAEIRQLEDALLAAAVAAENTLTIRRQIKRQEQDRRSPGGTAPPTGPATQGAPPDPGVASGEAGRDTSTGLREFRDDAGQSWRAWMITPGLSRAGRTKHVLGDFQLGWVCFEDSAAGRRRRLPGHPERWSELSDGELAALLEQAMVVRERSAARKGGA